MPCFPTTSSSRKNRKMFIKECMVPSSANLSGCPDPQKSRIRIWLELSNSGENQRWTQENIYSSCCFTIIPYYRSLSVPSWQCTESGLENCLLNMGTESDWSWGQDNLSVEHSQILTPHYTPNQIACQKMSNLILSQPFPCFKRCATSEQWVHIRLQKFVHAAAVEWRVSRRSIW